MATAVGASTTSTENWEFQGPQYRHLLVNWTDSAWSCYHCNAEHSQGEANLEIRGASAPVAIYGFKGEGNYVQIWVADSTDFFLLGYGGNASPFPLHCSYPPGYAAYPPSIIRVERTSRVTVGNVIVQTWGNETKCGLYDTGFAGTFYDSAAYSVMYEEAPRSGAKLSLPPLQWPVLYARGMP